MWRGWTKEWVQYITVTVQEHVARVDQGVGPVHYVLPPATLARRVHITNSNFVASTCEESVRQLSLLVICNHYRWGHAQVTLGGPPGNVQLHGAVGADS